MADPKPEGVTPGRVFMMLLAIGVGLAVATDFIGNFLAMVRYNQNTIWALAALVALVTWIVGKKT